MKKYIFSLLLIFCVFGYWTCLNKNPSKRNVEIVRDIDGNIYHTINIGTQTWMIENLNVTRYRNGDTIMKVLDPIQWSNLNTGAYCDFNNEPVMSKIYGKLYNWYTIQDKRNIAPIGWHVPTDSDWNTLEKYLDNTIDTTLSGSRGTDIGCKLREIGNVHWSLSNRVGNNSSGFTALPGAMRRGMTGDFGRIGEYGHWWTSTKHPDMGAWCRDLYYKSCEIGRGNGMMEAGLSIRCIKDN